MGTKIFSSGENALKNTLKGHINLRYSLLI